MSLVSIWFSNARSKALPQSIIPALLAVSMSFKQSGFSWWLAGLSVIGVMFAHLAVNLFDDYFDYKHKDSSYRNRMEHQGIRARIAKCSYLTSGQATLKQLLQVCIIFSLLALACGVVIWIFRGPVIIYLTLITALLGISYSGKPLKLSYRGLGEILIGILFGPLLMLGVYVAACGVLDFSTLFISVPVGLLVMNIVYTHAIMDYEADKQAGKNTLAVLIGNKNGMLVCLACLLSIAYACIIGGVLWDKLIIYDLAVLITLPMACALFYLMRQFVLDPHKKFYPKWWMGPMGDWQRLTEVGIDWFMIRWLLARNLLSFFCLILIIIYIIF